MQEARAQKAPVQIVCVTTQEPHQHVVKVGIGGSADAPFVSMTVEEVADAIMGGQEFYTEVHGVRSIVHRITCTATGCQVKTISSIEADTVTNDFDGLAKPCRPEPEPSTPKSQRA